MKGNLLEGSTPLLMHCSGIQGDRTVMYHNFCAVFELSKTFHVIDCSTNLTFTVPFELPH